MSALAMAGNSMVSGGYAAPVKPPVGIRTLREEYMKFTSRLQIPTNLKMIAERIQRQDARGEMVGSEERTTFPRFQHLFPGELLPPGVFMAALELKDSETLNGKKFTFDPEVMSMRDSMVVAYKPLVAKIRMVQAKELADLPLKPVVDFTRAWTAWETAWLRSREHHAVTALQPLAKAILSLEPLLLSAEKERLLPWPRVQHQKVITLKCLQGFIHSLSELSANVLPSLHRELDHDSRLLLLMDHVLSLRGDKSVDSCLEGLSAAPDVSFPEHQVAKGQSTMGVSTTGPLQKGMSLDAYAFKLLGSSVGDAAAAGKLTALSGNGQAGRAKLAASMGEQSLFATQTKPAFMESAPDTAIQKKAAHHAFELLSAFESIKDLLLSLKSCLELVDPSLDKDEAFIAQLKRFESAFRRAKKLFLEPDNLA
mmetsp:Transcript_50556/g.133484  ORF Transcript_50556/g.133484 Transcript_50556/m.133484 type:complete len:425 (-) Transcript_50556:82-1356(-)